MTTTQQTPDLPIEEVKEEQPYTFTEVGEGKYRLQYATGEVAEGTMEEIIKTNAKMTVDTKANNRELRSSMEALEEIRESQKRMAEALQPTPPPPSPEAIDRQNLVNQVLDLVGEGLELGNAQEVKQRMKYMAEQSAETRKRTLAASFFQACPDFPQTEEAANKIEEWRIANEIPEDKLTLNHLKSAHASCVQYGQYKPLSQEDINAQYQRMGQPQAATVAARAQAPPTLPTGQPEMTGTKNLWEMTPQEIQKMYFDKKARGES